MRRFHAPFIHSMILAILLTSISGPAAAQREAVVGVCHRDESTGEVAYLEVPESEVMAHLEHGDATAPNGPDDCANPPEPVAPDEEVPPVEPPVEDDVDPTEALPDEREASAPLAQNDEYTVEPGGTLVVPAPGVLGNDRGFTTATLVREPTWGSLDFGRDGSFTYVADRENPGSDGFAYQASNEEGYIDIGEVFIFLPPGVNSPPVAVDDTYALTGPGPYTVPAPGVLANDSDPDGDPISVAYFTSYTKSCQWFTQSSDGGFTFLLESGVTSSSCSVGITDGLAQVESGLFVSIVPPANQPVGTWDIYQLTPGGTLTVAAAQGVLANDVSPVGNPLAVSLFAGPFSGGSVSLNPDGSFTFTASGGPGPVLDVFIYQLTDTDTGASAAVGVRFDVP